MTILEAVVAVAARYPSVPLALLLAIGEQESGFDQEAQNHGPGDVTRGGAYGVFQVTRKTAEAYLGKLDDPSVLLDVVVNADLACQIIAADLIRYDKHIDDVICAYNSGKPKSRAPEVTRLKYLPSVKARYQKYRRLIDGKVKDYAKLTPAGAAAC